VSAGEELGFSDGDGRGGGVGNVGLSADTSSDQCTHDFPCTDQSVKSASVIRIDAEAEMLCATNLQDSHGLSKCFPLWCDLFLVSSSSGRVLESERSATVAAYRIAEVWADIVRLGVIRGRGIREGFRWKRVRKNEFMGKKMEGDQEMK